VLSNARVLAEDGYLVTLGIRPTYPATGYGYIQRAGALDKYDFAAYHVQRFKEKPDEQTARGFIERGDHDWNSGMFVWRVDRIWEELQRLMPDLTGSLEKITQAWGSPDQDKVVESIWPGIVPQTVDYGVMEKAERVVVIPAADLGWNDVGSWESLFEVFEPDSGGNIILDAEHLGLNTCNSAVLSDGTGRLIVTLGVKELIVVDTPDALLVCSRQEAQKVRDVVNLLKKQDNKRFL
jgi:mannose-1-phosphate guanylyltransferase